MTKTAKILILAIALGMAGYKHGLFNEVAAVRVDPAPVPSAALKSVVEPIRVKIQGTSKAPQVAAVYAAWADVVRRDGGKVIRDTRVFAEAHRNVLVLYGFDKGPAVGAEIDAAIATHLEIDRNEEGYLPKKVDTDKLVEVLEAISYAAR